MEGKLKVSMTVAIQLLVLFNPSDKYVQVKLGTSSPSDRKTNMDEIT